MPLSTFQVLSPSTCRGLGYTKGLVIVLNRFLGVFDRAGVRHTHCLMPFVKLPTVVRVTAILAPEFFVVLQLDGQEFQLPVGFSALGLVSGLTHLGSVLACLDENAPQILHVGREFFFGVVNLR